MPEEITGPAKPGTACLGCRRRKLKCSREQEGCSNCLRADLPCVYPTPEAGVKRKRGPYKKDKAARERHLEDLVRYLEPKGRDDGNNTASTAGKSTSADSPTPSTTAFQATANGFAADAQLAGHSRSGNPEDLVKDALIALTKSSVNDIDTQADPGKSGTESARHRLSRDAGPPGSHPSARRIFEYWDLFVHRVDPLLKIIHCPSYTKNLFAAVDRPREVGTHIETLLFSIYFAAVSTCTPREARARFGESRSALLQCYGKTIEAKLADSYGIPALESLQALVLYIVAIRRDDGDVSVRALFSLAVRMAQLIHLDEDPAGKYSPFEAELRRRLWWQLCGLESRAAEEGVARQTSIMERRNVLIASNLDDFDIQPDMTDSPAPRSGVAGTSFHVLRSEVISLAHRLWAIKKRFKLQDRLNETQAIRHEQQDELRAFRRKMQNGLLAHCDISRRFDWLLIRFYEAMSVKMHMIVEHPTTQIPNASMNKEARLDLLQSSVMIIGSTLGIEKAPQLGDWGWHFRGYMQWHSVAVVIAELGRSTNPAFANNAWKVLDPVLRSWDQTYEQKRDEPAWEHVNALIAKAREMRGKTAPTQGEQHSVQGSTGSAPAATEQQISGARPKTPTYGTSTYQQPPQPAQTTQHPTPLNPTSISFLPNFNHMLQHNVLQQQPPAPPTVHVPTSGCAMAMPGIDMAPSLDDSFDLGELDTLENIDFSAFDAVFGDDATWESSPNDFAWAEEGWGIRPEQR